MNEPNGNESANPGETGMAGDPVMENRRCFLQATGKWSAAAILAAVAGAMVSSPREARAAGWINRRGGGGGWINGGGGGGGWINRRGGGGAWINR